MKKWMPGALTFLIAFLLLAGCNLPLGKTATPKAGNEQTAVAQTVSAMQTLLASNATPLTYFTPVATLATMTPGEAVTGEAPQSTSTPLPTYKVGFITDVTIPDNMIIQPGTAFKKTWRLRNDGTGTWEPNFKLVFVNGDSMGGPASKTLDETVAPGETIDISVDLTAPSISKTYKGNWMLQTDKGVNFGIGPTSSSAFTVVINVQELFAVTNAVPAAYPPNWSGVCPVNIDLVATITATTAGKVTYYFVTPLGNSPTFEMNFTEASTQTSASYPLSVPGSIGGTIQVYIDTPNHQLFPTVANLTVTCQ